MADSVQDKPRDSRRRGGPRWWRRTLVGARRSNIFAVLEVAAAALLLTMLGVSWIALSKEPVAGSLMPSWQAAALLIGTLIPALGLVVMIGRRLALKRAEGSTARMHVRLVFFFSMIAAVPTLLVAVFASVLFQSGIQFWFSDESRGVLENANNLARSYYDESLRSVAEESVTMADDLRFELQRVKITSEEFAGTYPLQVLYRKLSASAILQKDSAGKLVAVALVDPDDSAIEERISPDMLARIDGGEPVVARITENRVEAITALDRQSGVYLYNSRTTNVPAFSQWQLAQAVLEDYDVITRSARSLQLRFNLALFAMSIALVTLAVWFALRFADRQVRPLTELVSAAREVGAGNYALRVEGRTGADEIGLLNRAFNRMTAQIEQQTTALVGANTQLQDRREFIETVLESITAGIISLDADGQVLLMNSSAKKLLQEAAGPALVGRRLDELAPQIAALVDAGLSSGLVQYGKGGELITLAVKVSSAGGGRVVTFEDITRQLLDQRQAAWSDVARRIAHEIKNPLTPIQLATERLNRRYRKQIETDGELFDELTSTIIRQVGDLRKMVDEFSSFARLPKPVFRPEDAVDLVRQALFLQEIARPEIDFAFTTTEGAERIDCDRHQFGQAMTNVIKNAAEAVEARARTDDVDYRGKIAVAVMADADHLTVQVTDNGIGLPKDRESIVEPYVTTREKGTGLGLAIVKKIVEEHGGEMIFDPIESGGTRVTLSFARHPAEAAGNSEAAE